MRTAGPPAPRAEPWRRTSGIHKIRKPRALAAVRALWEARDRLAAERDIAPGRVLPDAAIVDAAVVAPTSPAALAALPVFRGRSQRRLTSYWYAALAQAARLDPDELPGRRSPGDGPPPVARWADRDPAAAARLSAARAGIAALSARVVDPGGEPAAARPPAPRLLVPARGRRRSPAALRAGRRPRVAGRADRSGARRPGPPRRLTRPPPPHESASPASRATFAAASRHVRRPAGVPVRRTRVSAVRGGEPACREAHGHGEARRPAPVRPPPCRRARAPPRGRSRAPAPSPGVSAVRSTGPRRKGSNSSSTRSGAISGSPGADAQLGGRPAHARCGSPPSPPGRCAAPRSRRGSRRRARAAPGRPPSAPARAARAPAARGGWPRPASRPGRARRRRRGRPAGRRRGRRPTAPRCGPAGAARRSARRPAGVASRTTSPIRRSSSTSASGSARVTSTSVRSTASGVRSSWLALATNRRCASNAACSRSSIASKPAASSATSPRASPSARRVSSDSADSRRAVAVTACSGPEHPADQPPRHDARREHDEREGDQPGAQHLRLHCGADRGADLLGRHVQPADPHPAARRQGGNGVRDTADEQPAQPQQQRADQRDEPRAEHGEHRPQARGAPRGARLADGPRGIDGHGGHVAILARRARGRVTNRRRSGRPERALA